MSSTWSYKVKAINKSIDLLADGEKIGTLFGAGKGSEDNARLIAAAPSMYTLLSKLLYHCELEGWAVDEIEQLFTEINYGGRA